MSMSSAPPRMPAVFLGHGNPMNAITLNAWTRAWRALADTLPRPRAVLALSAHWYVPGLRVTVDERPRTIHDFGGFPPALHVVEYPASGSSELARQVASLLVPSRVELDGRWGLDHGTWSLLVHLYPDADVPVVQLSLDETLGAEAHHDVARRLRPLRDQGVLILGSGNVVHNLHAYSWGRHDVDPYEWGTRFEATIRQAILDGQDQKIVGYERLGRDAALAAPTPEHFLPLVYVLAQRHDDDAVSFPVDGFDDGSVSMLGVRLG